jgi:hypothetical protein
MVVALDRNMLPTRKPRRMSIGHTMFVHVYAKLRPGYGQDKGREWGEEAAADNLDMRKGVIVLMGY